jgi:hypothetical protein
MNNLLNAIVKYIDAKTKYVQCKAEAQKPCKHEWHLHDTTSMCSSFNKNNTWIEYVYICKKCMERKCISTNINDKI